MLDSLVSIIWNHRFMSNADKVPTGQINLFQMSRPI